MAPAGNRTQNFSTQWKEPITTMDGLIPTGVEPAYSNKTHYHYATGAFDDILNLFFDSTSFTYSSSLLYFVCGLIITFSGI